MNLKFQFEQLINSKVTNEQFVIIENVYDEFNILFPCLERLVAYYRLNGFSGICKLYREILLSKMNHDEEIAAYVAEINRLTDFIDKVL